MIRLITADHIKTKGEFKLDGLWVKRFSFNNPPDNHSKQTLTFEVVPFSYMDDGSRVFDNTRSRIVHIMDAEEYLLTSGDVDFVNAYFATEKSFSNLLTDRTDWAAQFEAPNLG